MKLTAENDSRRLNNGGFQTGKVITLSACHFIHDAYSSFLAPLLPLLIQKFSMSLTQAGFLSTIMQLPSLLNPFIGILADRVNLRYFIILAPALTAVPMSLIGLAPNYAVLLILLFITGVSVSLFHVPAPVVVCQLSGDKIGRGMSFYMTGGELARTLAPLIAVGAVTAYGLEGFYPVMIFGILASLFLYIKLKDLPFKKRPATGLSLLAVCRKLNYILVPLTLIVVARGFMNASFTAFLPTYVNMETGNIWLAGISLTVFESTGVAGALLSGSLSDHFGRRNILRICLLIAPAGMLGFTLLEGPVAVFMLIVTGFTMLSTTPVMLAMIQEHAGDHPAAANGLFMMIAFMARSAIVVVVGFIADHIGMKAMYECSAVIGFMGILFIRFLPSKK